MLNLLIIPFLFFYLLKNNKSINFQSDTKRFTHGFYNVNMKMTRNYHH